MTVAAGVLLGALLVMWAAYRGMATHWQSVPSTWDAVWHANEVRFILDTGQASSTHMGELRNVETHQTLYYPSVFHALTAVFCQLTGAAPTTGYTLSSVAASVWLFPTSAAMLTWRLLRPRWGQWRTAGAAATTAALSVSFTAVPYVEFGVAAMPNLAAYGVAVPDVRADRLDAAPPRPHPDGGAGLRGRVSVHLTGGFIVLLFLVAWWLLDVLWHPVRGRVADVADARRRRAAAALILLPQFISVRQQEDIIAGHSFLTRLSKKRGIFDAVFQHSRHLNDFPYQYGLIALAGIGGIIFAVQEDLVAVGGLAAARRGRRRRGNAARPPARRDGRSVRRVLLQGPAPDLGRHHAAADADGGHRVVRGGDGGGCGDQAGRRPPLEPSPQAASLPAPVWIAATAVLLVARPYSPPGTTSIDTWSCSATSTTR